MGEFDLMKQGKSTDEKDDDARLKKIMKAATGCDNVDEVRKKAPNARDSKPVRVVESAMEFLAEMEEDHEHVDSNQNAGGKPKAVAPDPKDDEFLKSVSLSGPEPKPPAPRASPEALTSPRSMSEEGKQSSGMTGSSASPQQLHSFSENEERNLTNVSQAPVTGSTENDLNYKWISIVYAIGSLLSLAFYLVEEYGSRPQRSSVASLNDLYIVFLPYIPCLAWTLLRLKQLRNVPVPIIDSTKKDQ